MFPSFTWLEWGQCRFQRGMEYACFSICHSRRDEVRSWKDVNDQLRQSRWRGWKTECSNQVGEKKNAESEAAKPWASAVDKLTFKLEIFTQWIKEQMAALTTSSLNALKTCYNWESWGVFARNAPLPAKWQQARWTVALIPKGSLNVPLSMDQSHLALPTPPYSNKNIGHENGLLYYSLPNGHPTIWR